MSHKQIYYSDKYDDEEFEYRLVPARGLQTKESTRGACHVAQGHSQAGPENPSDV
uniref:CDC28 protein kinase 1b n=1 Tax=Mus musculus TaxID=10090 RepID=V9GWZ0_MOUSE